MPTGTDIRAAAREAGLRYVTDVAPGLRRQKKGSNFRYLNLRRRPVKDEQTLRRIRSLAIPPAWMDVWICQDARGHLQATGRDARGRKQYRYHPLWRLLRDRTKYDKLLSFSLVLPGIRKRIDHDEKREGLPREKVLAAVVRLLDLAHMRVGNEEYARLNHSFGLTTLRDKHVEVLGSHMRFRFRGKSGQHQDIDIADARLARIVRRCEELPGHELFQYVTREGDIHDIHSDDVNEYLKEITKDDVTAKDFRTWGGTVHAAIALYEAGDARTETDAKKHVAAAIRDVARLLGNRPATCRKYYIDPRVIEAYLDRSLAPVLHRHLNGKRAQRAHGLKPEERAVVELLTDAGAPKKRRK